MNQNVPLLKMSDIRVTFPAVVALDNVSFSLKSGEIHALLGENGAGKSTLIKALTGVNKRDKGTIQLNGKQIDPKSPLDAQKAGISSVYQEVNLCPHLSVAENIYIGREPLGIWGINWKKMNQDAAKLTSSFGLKIDVTQPLSAYSIAIQQMIAIIRAVDIQAQILILDEPTSSLTAIEVEKLFETMIRLKKSGMGIIFVTHFLDQVYQVTDRITVLRNGELVGTYPTEELPKVQLVAKMIGKEYQDLGKHKAYLDTKTAQEETPMLSITNGESANGIENLDLRIYPGKVTGLCGLLGAGKTETARIIFGIDPLQQGKMAIKNGAYHPKSPIDAIRHNIGYCPEDRKSEGIIGDLSIRENIILALQNKRGIGKAITRAEADRIAEEYIQKLAIKTPSADQLIKNLSGGNQQKVILARWMATHPELLILDEPTRGIDIGTKAEIQKIVMALAEQGMALIFISSELDETLRVSDRIEILRDKKKIGELVGTEITESAIMESIAGGAHE